MGNTPGDFFNPSHPYGRVSYLSPGDLASPSPHWFWKKGRTFAVDQVVSCSATASINGVTIGTVTGQQNVAVWAPYHEFVYNAGAITLFSPGTADVALHGNMNWSGRVGTPDLFLSYWGSAGIWQFTQMCDLDRTLTPLNPLGVVQGVYTSGFLLDGEFNYSSMDGGPWAADSVNQTDADGNITVTGTEGVSGDVPTIGLDGMVLAHIDDAFETWMMYQPPGLDIQWVPLNLMDWTMKCDASYSSEQGWFILPPDLCQVQDENPSSTFPEWEGAYAGTH